MALRAVSAWPPLDLPDACPRCPASRLVTAARRRARSSERSKTRQRDQRRGRGSAASTRLFMAALLAPPGLADGPDAVPLGGSRSEDHASVGRLQAPRLHASKLVVAPVGHPRLHRQVRTWVERCRSRIPHTYVVLKPLDETTADDQPALVVLFVNPDQLSALIVMADYGRAPAMPSWRALAGRALPPPAPVFRTMGRRPFALAHQRVDDATLRQVAARLEADHIAFIMLNRHTAFTALRHLESCVTAVSQGFDFCRRAAGCQRDGLSAASSGIRHPFTPQIDRAGDVLRVAQDPEDPSVTKDHRRHGAISSANAAWSSRSYSNMRPMPLVWRT